MTAPIRREVDEMIKAAPPNTPIKATSSFQTALIWIYPPPNQPSARFLRWFGLGGGGGGANPRQRQRHSLDGNQLPDPSKHVYM